MFKVQVDPRSVLGSLTQAEERQLPYAAMLGLNNLALDVQADMRAGLEKRFRLRRKDWNLRGIKIAKPDRATKTSWRVIIQVAPEVNYFNKFEPGGTKFPVGGRHYVWIPNDKVFRNQVIQTSNPLRPVNLHLHRDPHGRILGDNRTFMLFPTGRGDSPLVVQRQTSHRGYTKRSIQALTLETFQGGLGPRQARERRHLVAKKKKDATVLLYKLKSSVRVQAQLQFVGTVENTVQAKAISRFREAMAKAMETAR